METKPTTAERIEALQEIWQDAENGVLAKFCAQWCDADWGFFLLECHGQGLDVHEECVRLYEEQGDF